MSAIGSECNGIMSKYENNLVIDCNIYSGTLKLIFRLAKPVPASYCQILLSVWDHLMVSENEWPRQSNKVYHHCFLRRQAYKK